MKDFNFKEYDEMKTREEFLKYIDDLYIYVQTFIGEIGSTDKREKFKFLESKKVTDAKAYIQNANEKAELLIRLIKYSKTYQTEYHKIANENLQLQDKIKELENLLDKIEELENLNKTNIDKATKKRIELKEKRLIEYKKRIEELKAENQNISMTEIISDLKISKKTYYNLKLNEV